MHTTVKIDYTFRRVIGLTLGTLPGLTYGPVSQTINTRMQELLGAGG